MLRKTVVFVGLLISFQLVSAQQNSFENTIEFGPAAGAAFYLGDANRIPFAHLRPAFGGEMRYPFNTRLALKGIALLEEIAKNYTYYANYTDNPIVPQKASFKHHLLSAELHLEFNFFPYELSDFSLESATITPYILAGGGIAGWPGGKSPVVTFGVGGKWKLNRYFNLSLEWTINKTFSDNLEKGWTLENDYSAVALNNPYSLNKSHLYNNDYYSSITFALTFSIYTKPCDCKTVN